MQVGGATVAVLPDRALGWSLDGGDAGAGAPLFEAGNRAALRELAVSPVSYRLRTELAGEAWHWSAYGRWSDPARRQGYWTGDPGREDTGWATFGYRLPRRGNSRDEANDDGYSRLDDGDPQTFWKSNPYLARPFAPGGDPRPEWIKIDLGAEYAVDGLRMIWRDPFARRLRVQYWRGDTVVAGRWITFPGGEAALARSGPLTLKLADRPRRVRYLRLLMSQPSGTAPAGASDLRDAQGYAVAEIEAGRWRGGALQDAIRHAADGRRQTRMVVSSTDPWHREGDIDRRIEQPSPLQLLRLGLLQPGRTMLPLGVLYDTPENAVASLAYFRRFGLDPRQVELGEEPEGQRTDPELFARLHAQLAARVHAAAPELQLVGPSLINALADTWLDDDPDSSWTRRMLRALRAQAQPEALAGVTLEHYPDDDMCADPAARVRREPQVMADIFARLLADGVREPVVLTEIGQSAYAGRADVEPVSALFTATALAEFLRRGGDAAYLYSLSPGEASPAERKCAGAGDMMAFQLDRSGHARWAMPMLQAFRLVSQVWLQPGAEATRVMGPAPGETPASTTEVFAYPALRPDARWSVLLVNASRRTRSVRLRFVGGGPAEGGATELWRYGADQYRWSAAARRPLRDLPPARTLGPAWGATLRLPPLSLAVVRDR